MKKQMISCTTRCTRRPAPLHGALDRLVDAAWRRNQRVRKAARTTAALMADAQHAWMHAEKGDPGHLRKNSSWRGCFS